MLLLPEEPPEFGVIEFKLSLPPVSQQASTHAKKVFISEVREITRPLEYLIDSEVQIDIDWFIHERLRWETDQSPDVDNIIKPLLDALCGPEGILIDDCQVQSIQSSWINWTRQDQELAIRIRFDPDHYLQKRGLSFVRMKDALCYPVPAEIREKGALQTWLNSIEQMLLARCTMASLTGTYYPARYLLPPGLIHRSRVNGFPVHDLAALRAQSI